MIGSHWKIRPKTLIFYYLTDLISGYITNKQIATPKQDRTITAIVLTFSCLSYERSKQGLCKPDP